MAVMGFDLPTFRAPNSSPPPPAAVGGAATAAQAPTPYLAPMAAAVANQVGRYDANVSGLFQPGIASMREAGTDIAQGNVGQGLGAGIRGVAQGVGAAGAAAGGIVAAPFVQAARLGGNVLQGIFGGGDGGAAQAATPPKNITPAATMTQAQADKATAMHLTQAGMASQGMTPGAAGGGSILGKLPAFLVPQIAGALATAKAPTNDAMGSLVDIIHQSAAASEAEVNKSVAAGQMTTEQASAKRAQNMATSMNALRGLVSLGKIGVAATPE